MMAPTVDLLVLYTPAARVAAGGKTGIENLIQLGVTETNLAYQNSSIIPRIRLMQMKEVSYTESGNIGLDLDRLQNPADGFLDDALPLRNLYGADFVKLVVNDSCGVAYLMCGNDPSFQSWAYSVTGRVCISPNYTFAHELGHNMGSNHAPQDPTGCGAYNYSFGHKDQPQGFRTVMAYSPGTRVLNFSNPSVHVLGRPTGTASRNNAASLNNVRNTIANFRAEVDLPEITSPAVGSTLVGGSANFTWSANGASIAEWWLYVGSSEGASDLYDSGSLGSSLSATVHGLPTDGRQLHVSLWYRVGGAWQRGTFNFTAATVAGSMVSMTAPTPGSTLSGASTVFTWAQNGASVTAWWLYVGSTQGASDLHDSGNLGAALTTTVHGLPTDGRQIHVRLWYQVGGVWQVEDFLYTADTMVGGPVNMTSPSPGSTLTAASATFTWDPNGASVSEWWFYLGSSQGAFDIHDSGTLGASLSTTVNGIPTDGRALHARLWYRVSGDWQFRDFQYTAHAGVAAGTVAITSPSPGSTLSGTSATFSWVPNGVAVTEWWFYLGSTSGAKDLFDSGTLGTSTGVLVNGIPADGRQLHARLWYRVGGAWQSRDFQYVATSPSIASPTPGATLAGSSVTFSWVANGTPVDEWWFYLGSSAGAVDVVDTGSLGASLSVLVNGIPTDGRALHARLWYRIGSTWHSKDFQYTAAP